MPLSIVDIMNFTNYFSVLSRLKKYKKPVLYLEIIFNDLKIKSLQKNLRRAQTDTALN